MTAVWNRQRFEIPGIETRSWLDTTQAHPPRTPNCYTNDQSAPGQYKPSLVQTIEGATWHTVHGRATEETTPSIDPHCAGMLGAMAYATDFARPSREASTHFVTADNGLLLVLADLITDRCWHAGAWNPWTIGTELDQSSETSICQAAIDTGVNLAWWLCEAFWLQPMLPVDARGEPDLGDIVRFMGEGSKTFRGHYFHANQDVRGRGDPGPAFARALLKSGFEGFNARSYQDQYVWKQRQIELGMPARAQDGIPGPATVTALRTQYGRNTWVVRQYPSDWWQAPALVAAGYLGYRWYKHRGKKGWPKLW